MLKPVLIVEDDVMQQKMLKKLLRNKLQFESCIAENGQKALEILKQDNNNIIKLIILDIDMPIMGGIETLKIIRQQYSHLSVIMLTGSQDISTAIEAMKLGATDFLTKPYDPDRIAVTLKNALKISILTKEVKRLKKEKEGSITFENLIGHDNGLLPVITTARKAATSDIPVLITGETGVGKELFSQSIHGESLRKKENFVAVNCGAIPNQLIESILFGHKKGSFTGAISDNIGKFKEADGGTIFLDEIGELPLDAQVKLLRVLQQQEIEPIGNNKTIPINVRIISATNRDLKKEVEKGKFREDLYFRLNVLEIKLPPLRERKQDIPKLARFFIERFCIEKSVLPYDLTSAAENTLMQYEWPGNVRELENVINRSVVLNDKNTLDINSFSPDISIKSVTNAKYNNLKELNYSIITPDGNFKEIDTIQNDIIQIALHYYDKNVSKTANALGIPKSTLYRKISSH